MLFLSKHDAHTLYRFWWTVDVKVSSCPSTALPCHSTSKHCEAWSNKKRATTPLCDSCSLHRVRSQARKKTQCVPYSARLGYAAYVLGSLLRTPMPTSSELCRTDRKTIIAFQSCTNRSTISRKSLSSATRSVSRWPTSSIRTGS